MNQASTPHSNYKLEYGVTGNKCPSGDEAILNYDNFSPDTKANGNICTRALEF